MGKDKTAGLTIRPLMAADIDTLARWFEDPDDIAMFDKSAPIPVSPEAVGKSWKEDIDAPMPRSSLWYAAIDDSGRIRGICGLESISYLHGDAKIPLFVERGARHSGIGLAMSVWVINLGFSRLRLNRISTMYRHDNSGTGKLVDRLGFQKEGLLRQAWFVGGVYVDVVLVGLLKEDWIARQKQDPALAVSDGNRLYALTKGKV